MTRKDKYHVCRSCGGDWCWERDLWKHAHCSVCGSQFPRPKTAWSKGDGKSRQWETEWPALPSASQQRKWVTQTEKPKKVYGALNQVWNFIPEEAQQAIASAGFRVQLDANAAVQGNGKGNGKPAPGSKGEKGPGKGKGHPPYKELTPAQLETAKGLFESATDEQKEVLKLMGVEQPAQPTPDLAELCRQHIDALPESIKALLEKQTEPEKAPTVTETSRKFKVATADLRELILKKSALQLKINKTKTTYAELLAEMQQLQEVLSKQQQEVTALQQELQDRVQADQPSPGPNLLEILQDLGTQVSEEQAAKLAGFRFQGTETGDTRPLKEAEKGPQPSSNLPGDMEVETPPGLPQSNPNKERNGRSRSPKGGEGEKPKPGDNKV